MPIHWYEGKVRSIEQLSKTTRQYNVSIEGETDMFDFKPGQFVTMDLPVGEKRTDRWRSYTIASHPDGSNELQFCIVKSGEGPGTKYLFDQLKVGTSIRFKGPDGGFVLPDDLTKELVMLCTGTGVAPFRSMINHIRYKRLPFHRIHLIFGTTTEENILYKQEFDDFVKENSSFRYSVALSRENKSDYYHGYIHNIYLNEYKNVHPNRHFYICGWSKMIDEAVANLLLQLKYDKTQIHYELYG